MTGNFLLEKMQVRRQQISIFKNTKRKKNSPIQNSIIWKKIPFRDEGKIKTMGNVKGSPTKGRIIIIDGNKDLQIGMKDITNCTYIGKHACFSYYLNLSKRQLTG